MMNMTYNPLMVTTESGEVEVLDRVKAMRMITATCYANQYDIKNISKEIHIKDIADHFNIDLDSIKVRHSKDRVGAELHGYYNEYYFEE